MEEMQSPPSPSPFKDPCCTFYVKGLTEYNVPCHVLFLYCLRPFSVYTAGNCVFFMCLIPNIKPNMKTISGFDNVAQRSL